MVSLISTLNGRGLLWLAAAVCSFSSQVPALQASDVILRVDTEGLIGEVPELLSVVDFTAGDVTFPSSKHDPEGETATAPREIGEEHFGHGTRRLIAIADAVGRDLTSDRSPSAIVDGPLPEAERHVLCSMRSAQIERSQAVTDWLVTLLSKRLHRSEQDIATAFRDDHFCDQKEKIHIVETELKAVLTERDGIVLSSNPVWNACVSGDPVTKALIAGNRDVFHHRRGHLHKDIPYSCRDYHRGNSAVWHHPDFPDLEVTLDDRGRLLGGLPAGYVAVRERQVVAEKE